jgi:ABC-type multidrug transport system fused ATPase/permease subunit
MTNIHRLDQRREARPATDAFHQVMRREPLRLTVGVLFALLQSVLLIPMPIVVRRAFDHAIPNRDRNELLVLAATVVALSALSGVATILSQRLVQRAAKQATEALRVTVVERVFSADLSQVDQLDPEDVHERLIGDPSRVELGVGALVLQGLPAVVLFVGLISLLMWIERVLTLAVAISIPIVVAINRSVRPALRKSLIDSQHAFETLGRHSFTLVRAQLLLRGRGTDAEAYEKVCAQIKTLRDQSSKRANRLVTRSALQATGLSFATAVTLFVGGDAVISRRISVASLLSFFAAVALIRAPSTMLASLGPTLMEGRLSLARLDRFLSTPMKQRAADGGEERIEHIRDVEFSAVSFAYEGGEGAIEDLNFSVRRARVFALSGPNGSGKTTVLTLLLGLVRPTGGAITANDVPLESLDGTQFRRRLGVLFQHSHFLPGTLRENLMSGRPNATIADISVALDDAEAASIVARLPNGLDTETGEDFDRLSGGERQRLALARALLGRPGFVVLDEPSNHLPTSVVIRVIERMRMWPDPPAVFLISHDSQLLQVADDHLTLDSPSTRMLIA